MKAEFIINKNFVIGETLPRLYGFSVEHIGRDVYDGIYEPDHRDSDDMGFAETHRNMPRFGEWEPKVPDQAYSYVNCISIHQYYVPGAGGEEYFAKPCKLDDFIKSAATMCDSIRAIKRSCKDGHEIKSKKF